MSYSAKRSPNILFIVADDLNAWIGPLGGHPDVQTPTLDRLSSLGTTFLRTYCSAPYCNASRMGVFTGCLPATTGIYGNEPLWEVPGRRSTFVELLREAGYYAFGAGKVFHGTFDYASATKRRESHASWRDVSNRSELWDEFVPFSKEPLPPGRPLNGMFDYSAPEQVASRNFLFDWGPIPAEDEAALPDEAVFRAVASFLSSPPSQPFFCAAGFYKPHLPWHVPERFFSLYPLDSISLPFVKTDDLDDVPALAKTWAISPPDHETVLAHGQWRHAVQGYLASVSYCDWMVGRIIECLRNSPCAEDTIIVLWGDNGFHLGEKLHWRKFVLWEEATRVPMIIIPHFERSSVVPRVAAPVSLLDLFPTIFDLAGLQAPATDAESLLPLMQGRAHRRTHPPISTWKRGNHSIRSDQWRFTAYSDGGEELYDHDADPYEWNNLIGDDRFRDVAEYLRTLLPK